ncbi:cation:proton antiporter [Sarcina ventriculi]|uniref:Inner membrane protein ybaL n=1 Tax=Sarcina ventriculi TaxID=1267 RepID=A0ABP2AS78_SARVE|nr:cation:proton antiporter [Sarcina ventriculi]CUN45861.1 Inner membrane protein ybaL [Sarcina ventriculi]
MLSYKFLFDIAVILLSTKALGLVTKRFKLPQVVGALLAGLVLGPAVLNILHETDFIQQLAELGVIVLMFTAGLETDIKELKKSGVASVVIAILGMIVPLILGFILANFFNTNNSLDSSLFLQHMFIGVILTATSVSITVETLRELGKLNSNAGNAILGAAIIDDILGIIALTIISSCASSDTSTNIWIVIGKILLFFILAIMVGIVIFRLMNKEMKTHNTDLRRFVIFSFVFCLLLSYAAEEFFGVADITGAFIAGLILSGTERKHYILSRFETSSYMLLSPIFFASIGIKVEIPKMSKEIIIFSILLIIIAVISKIIGCGLGAKLCKYTNSEALQIGTGMVSRGEVALIMANKGNALGLMSSIFFGPVVIMVVITTIISPILLKLVFHKENIKIA